MTNRRIRRHVAIASSVAATVVAPGCSGTTDPGGVGRFAGTYDVTTVLHTYSSLAPAANPGDSSAQVTVLAGGAATHGTMVVSVSGASTLDVTVTMHELPCVSVTEFCNSSVVEYRGTMSLSQDSTEVSVDATSATERIELAPGKFSGGNITGTFAWFLGFGPDASSYKGTFIAVRLPP